LPGRRRSFECFVAFVATDFFVLSYFRVFVIDRERWSSVRARNGLRGPAAASDQTDPTDPTDPTRRPAGSDAR